MASTRRARRAARARGTGSPAPPPPQGLIGGAADYAIGELVGVGLIGPVRRGRYLPTGAAVDLEAIPEHLEADPAFVARLVELGRAASHVRDSRLVAVYDVLHDAGKTLYLITEPFDAPSLAERAPDGCGLPRPEAVEVAKATLDALDLLHTAGIAHGGLTRRTILRSGRSRVRLSGVPLAALLSAWGSREAAGPTIAGDLAEAADLITSLVRDPLPRGRRHRPLPRWLAPVLRKARRPAPLGFESAAQMAAAIAAADPAGTAREGARTQRTPAEDEVAGSAEAPPAHTKWIRPQAPAAPEQRAGARRWGFRAGLAAASIAAGVATGLILNATVLPQPAAGTLRVHSVSLDVAPAGSCDTTLQFTATGSVDGHGVLVYRWAASGGRSSGEQTLAISPGARSFAVTQSWRPPSIQDPVSVSFEIVKPAPLVITRAVDARCP